MIKTAVLQELPYQEMWALWEILVWILENLLTTVMYLQMALQEHPVLTVVAVAVVAVAVAVITSVIPMVVQAVAVVLVGVPVAAAAGVMVVVPVWHSD